MPFADTHLRPPAYCRTPLQNIQAVLDWFAGKLFPCRHLHTTLPHNNHQRCIDCGAHRLYIFETPESERRPGQLYLTNCPGGIFKGKWQKAGTPGDPNRVVAQRLIVKGLESGRLLDKRRCMECGEFLNPSGSCPTGDMGAHARRAKLAAL